MAAAVRVPARVSVSFGGILDGQSTNAEDCSSSLNLRLCCRVWPGVQLAALASLEILYAGLHVYPLSLLVLPGPVTAEVFMQSFTKAQYFASELALLIALACCAPLR